MYWCCTARHDEKCRPSWPVSSFWNSEYICPTRSISRSKHNFESNSEIFWYGEIPRKNWNRMTNMLLRDLLSIQAIFPFFKKTFWRGTHPFFYLDYFTLFLFTSNVKKLVVVARSTCNKILIRLNQVPPIWWPNWKSHLFFDFWRILKKKLGGRCSL